MCTLSNSFSYLYSRPNAFDQVKVITIKVHHTIVLVDSSIQSGLSSSIGIGLPKALSVVSSSFSLDFLGVLIEWSSGSGVPNGDEMCDTAGNGAVGVSDSAVSGVEFAISRGPLSIESGDSLYEWSVGWTGSPRRSFVSDGLRSSGTVEVRRMLGFLYLLPCVPSISR